MSYAVAKSIRFCGLRRSGNHALINWIMAHEKGESLFVNDIRHYRSQRHRVREALELKPNPDLLIHSYEDYRPKFIMNGWFGANSKEYRETVKVEKSFNVLLLRDPLNLFASRARKEFFDVTPLFMGMTDLWVLFAKEYMGETNYLGEDKVVISFNLWFKSREYRDDIAEKLGFENKDFGIDEVSKHGKGSSFDDCFFDNRGSEMLVLERYKQYFEDYRFINFFKTDRLLELAEKIFSDEEEIMEAFAQIKNDLQTGGWWMRKHRWDSTSVPLELISDCYHNFLVNPINFLLPGAFYRFLRRMYRGW